MKSKDEDVVEVDKNRRNFVKKLGAAFAGIGAILLSPLGAAKTVIGPDFIDTPEMKGNASSRTNITSIVHTSWESGNSQEEIHRISLDSNEKLEIWRMELPQKGGGSTSSNFELEVYDQDQNSVLASTTGKKTDNGDPIGVSGVGSTVLIRLTNQTGQVKTAGVSVDGKRVKD